MDGDPTGRRQAEPTREGGGTGCSRVQAQRCQDVGRQTVMVAPGRAERARDKSRNNRGNAAVMPATPGGGARPAVNTSR